MELIDRVVADPRLGRSFEDSNIPRVKDKLAEQICELSGGPCQYSRDSMRETHAGHHITESELYSGSPPSGDFTISVPNGRYRLRVWHENLAAMFPMQTLEITDGVAPLSVALNVSADHATLAQWPASQP